MILPNDFSRTIGRRNTARVKSGNRRRRFLEGVLQRKQLEFSALINTLEVKPGAELPENAQRLGREVLTLEAQINPQGNVADFLTFQVEPTLPTAKGNKRSDG